MTSNDGLSFEIVNYAVTLNSCFLLNKHDKRIESFNFVTSDICQVIRLHVRANTTAKVLFVYCVIL